MNMSIHFVYRTRDLDWIKQWDRQDFDANMKNSCPRDIQFKEWKNITRDQFNTHKDSFITKHHPLPHV